MRGKILISLLALGATSAVFANGAIPVPVAEPAYFDGIYLGLGAGVQHQSMDVKNTITDTLYDYADYINLENPIQYADYTSNLKADIGNTAIGGEVFAGYGQTFNSLYYAGAELYARYANAEPQANYGETTRYGYSNGGLGQSNYNTIATTTSVEIQSDFSFGGALKLGYLITPKTMIYVLAGVEQTTFDVDVNHGYAKTSSSSSWISPAYSHGYSFDKSKWAFVPGIGIETMISNNLSLSAQYTYADYGSISNGNDYVNLHKGDYTPDPYSGRSCGRYDEPYAATVGARDDIDLSRGLFTLRLSYRFNGI